MLALFGRFLKVINLKAREINRLLFYIETLQTVSGLPTIKLTQEHTIKLPEYEQNVFKYFWTFVLNNLYKVTLKFFSTKKKTYMYVSR